MLLLLILYLVLPKQRPLLKDFMATCNGLLLFLIGANLLYWAYDLFSAWYGQNSYEQWAVPDGYFGLSYIVVHLLLQCITAILLLFKRGRRMIVISLLAWLFSSSFLTAFISEKLNPLFSSDYLPSSWSVKPISFYQQWIGWLLPALAFTVTALAFYWLHRSYRKHRLAVTAASITNAQETKKL
jgi:hypothetical protein